MARGFLNAMLQAAREAERAQARRVREIERSQRMHQRFRVAEAREQKRQYIESRQAEVEDMNQDLEEEVGILKTLLVSALDVPTAIDFEKYRIKPELPILDLGDLKTAPRAPEWCQYEPKKASWFERTLPGAQRKYAERLAQAQYAFDEAKSRHARQESERLAAIEKQQNGHERALQIAQIKAKKQNEEVDAWMAAFDHGEREGVEQYCSTVLSNSAYPEHFPQEAKVAYLRDSRQVVVEYDLPLMDEIIPKVKGYAYVKTSDKVNESPRPEKDRRSLYSSVIAQITLRCLYELFSADTDGLIDTILFNGHVDTIHPGTGQRIHPCLVTVRTTRDLFKTINLEKADPPAALQTLQASFSKSPAELAPVRPLLEFNMIDSRFVQESDVLSTLDQRPNLMDLSPGEFESLITNLFEKMGLETRLTQASRDGGVDCVAYDPRPIFGGKVVIQAKRYKNTVGVSAVRDLYGTMQNEGASKGILVTTSGYGKAAFEFANGKPLELLDGGHLLFLLKEHAETDAKIVMPEDWRDPVMDSPIP